MWAASLIFAGTALTEEHGRESYQIVALRARIRIYPASRAITCIDTLFVRPRAGAGDSVRLEMPPASLLESASANGRDALRDRQLLTGHLPDDTTSEIVLRYSLTIAQPREFSVITDDQAVLRDVDILPRGPSSFRSVRLIVVVPPDWDAVTVGALARRDSSADSAACLWEFDQPLREIGWVCAGRFRTLGGMWKQAPLSLHLFPQDSADGDAILRLAGDVLDFYSRHFSPYRFPKLSIVEIDDRIAGRNVLAISASSFIMVKHLAFVTEDAFNRVVAILPHEIAHQWWPLTVFVADSDAAFLSEGMCEYSDRLYRESSGTLTLRDSLSRHPLLRPLLLRIQKGRDIPLQGKVDLRAATTQYLKGAYVHQMLRTMLGDSAFYRLYREYAERFAMKRTGLDDFQALAERLAGKDLRWFFDQWVKKTGAPRLRIYNVKSARQGAEWITRGRVRLVGYDKFSAVVPVGVKTGSGILETRVWVGTDTAGVFHNDVPFEIRTADEPRTALLDPHGDLLELRRIPPKFSDFREPADGILVIGTPDPGGAIHSLARRDSARLEDAGWSIILKDDTLATLADLQQERVFLYGRSARNELVIDAEKKFPMQFRNDSIVVNDEVLGDSTLALLQVIENPYLPQAMLSWIAPLSEKAHPELLPYDWSWVLLNGSDVISSGTWESRDDDLEVNLRRN